MILLQDRLFTHPNLQNGSTGEVAAPRQLPCCKVWACRVYIPESMLCNARLVQGNHIQGNHIWKAISWLHLGSDCMKDEADIAPSIVTDHLEQRVPW